MPHRDGHPQPQKLDLEATTIQVSFAPPPRVPAAPDRGQGVCQEPARPGKAVNASGGGQGALRPHQEGRWLTYRLHAGPGGGQETMRGRGKTEQRRTVRNSRPALSSSPARRHGQGPHRGAGARTAPGQRGSWDTCGVACTQDTTRDTVRTACPTLPVQQCPGPPATPHPLPPPPPQDTHLLSQRWSVSSAEAPAG